MGPVHTIRKQFIFGDMVSVIFSNSRWSFWFFFILIDSQRRDRIVLENTGLDQAHHLLILDIAQQRRLSIFLAQTPHNNSATNYLTRKDSPLGWSYFTHSEGDRSGKIKYT
jgi:hypothetical protein